MERRRFESELYHLGLLESGHSPAGIMRKMKFEIQTNSVVYRTGRKKPYSNGQKREALKRKFGPKEFLHEGTGIELQSEAHGFVELETPKWSHGWCELKARIKEAVGMVETMSRVVPIIDTGSKEIKVKGKPEKRATRFVKFPFPVNHLRKTKSFPVGLEPEEWLEVEILEAPTEKTDPSWWAKIQASESFTLLDFESYLREHRPGRFKGIPIAREGS